MNWNILDKGNQLPKVAVLTEDGTLYILALPKKEMPTEKIEAMLNETVEGTFNWGVIKQIKLGELKE